MDESIAMYRKGNTLLKVFYEELPVDPRSWDNLGKMICLHRRYYLGDEHDITTEDFSSWSELEEYIQEIFDPPVMLPLYLYDHSGITMSTSTFSCPWDSGQVGFIYATKRDILSWYGVKKLDKATIENATHCLEDEVKIYDLYLRGEVYSYTVEEECKCPNCGDEHTKVIDGCCGFMGLDWEEVKKSIFDHANLNPEDFEQVL